MRGSDRSRRPYRHANQLPFQIETQIVRLKQDKPITDFASRYLFACEALSTTKEAYAFPVFEAVFKEFGLPKARDAPNFEVTTVVAFEGIKVALGPLRLDPEKKHFGAKQ